MSWEPLNLALLEERPKLEPTLGGVGICYPGKRHVFSGAAEAAKTLAAYAIGLAEARAGGKVLALDFEMGPYDARDRMRELGATADDFERILYVEPETPASEEIIFGLIEYEPTLVVIDAAAGAYDLEALDDNKRADVERFASIYVRTFWLRGIATILIDHVVKNADHRGKYAIGSERKVGSADVHIGFEPITALKRGGTGLYRLVTHKDRFGHLPRPRAAELELRSDPATHAITWVFKPPAEEETDTGFRPTALMERVSRHLELQSEAISQNAIEKEKHGKAEYVRLAITCLVREGFAEQTAGARSARLIRSLHPFREDDLVPTSSRGRSDDLVPTSSRQEPLEQAESTTSSHLVPTSSLVPESSSSQFALSPTGGANWRDEVGGTPLLGDAMYPILLAKAVRAGHLTEAEAEACLVVHELIEPELPGTWA